MQHTTLVALQRGNAAAAADGVPGSEEITEEPRHPYTISLMASVPVADPDQPLAGGGASGDVPSPVNPPSGCPFHPRCPYRVDACSRTMPDLVTDRHGHALACHNPPPAAS